MHELPRRIKNCCTLRNVPKYARDRENVKKNPSEYDITKMVMEERLPRFSVCVQKNKLSLLTCEPELPLSSSIRAEFESFHPTVSLYSRPSCIETQLGKRNQSKLLGLIVLALMYSTSKKESPVQMWEPRGRRRRSWCHQSSVSSVGFSGDLEKFEKKSKYDAHGKMHCQC